MWRQDENGNEFLVSSHRDRVEALARVLIFDSGYQHKQHYEVRGDRGPAMVTNRDLYLRVLWLGERMRETGRTLSEYLRALLFVSASLREYDPLDLDTVGALFTAAGRIDPPAFDHGWRSADLRCDGEKGYPAWEKVIKSQLADLAELPDPLPEFAALGIEARRSGTGPRDTIRSWYNFDPASYLECGVAGTVGGWTEADGTRVAVAPDEHADYVDEPALAIVELVELSWDGLSDIAICGQTYE